MYMKKLIGYLIVLLVFVSCEQKPDSLKIGVIAPLTGYAALPGQMCIKGVDMAKSEISDNVEFIIEDCQSSPKTAITLYRKLYAKGVRHFIVCGGQFAMAVTPLTKDKDVVIFATAAANIDLLSATNRCFRVFPHPNNVINKLYDFASDSLGLKNASIVYLQNDAYSLYAKLYESKIVEGGTVLKFKEGFSANQSDFKNIISKLAKTNSEYVFLASMGDSSISFTKQLSGNPQTKSMHIISDMNFSLPQAAIALKHINTPVHYVDADIDDDFIFRYKNKYNELPNAYSYYSYIIPNIIVESIAKSGNSNIDNQIQYIRETEFKISSNNYIDFDECGEVIMPLTINKLAYE